MSTAGKYSLTWDLDSLLPHPETDEFCAELQRFRCDLELLAERSEHLPAVGSDADNVNEWVEFLAEYESVAGRARDLNAFVGCHAAADAENKLFQQLEGRLSALEPLRERISTNIEFALKAASDQQVAAFIDADRRLGAIAFFIHDRRRNAELRLPKAEELLAADLAVDGIHGWGRLYDRVSGALRVRVMQRGEIVEKSAGQVQFDSPQRAVRENNFYAADKAWNSIADTCADALNHIAGTRLTLDRRLGLPDHLEVPCRNNRLRRETLEAMWTAVSQRKPVLLKYLNRKAEAFGLEKLAWYDIAPPFPVSAGLGDANTVSYDEACELVIETFHEFSPEFGDFARRAIEQRWIEVEDRTGKRQGGFCTSFPTQVRKRWHVGPIQMVMEGEPGL